VGAIASGGDAATSASDGGTPTVCGSSPTTGCACDTPGQQLACGQVHRVDGDYISCSPGYRTCSADGEWGDCLGDRVGDPHSPTRGFVLESLQLDASGCVGNPCDPSCQSYLDTAVGVDAAVDSGLVWNDAGVSLVPIYADSGPSCTGFTITPLNQTVTVTSIPKTTDPSTSVPTVTYGSSQQYKASVTPSGCFSGVVPALWGMDRNDLGTLDSTTGFLTVFTGVATATPINIASFAGGLSSQTTTASVVVNAVDTSAAGSYATSFSGAGTGTDPGNTILYPYDGTVLPLGLQPPIVQWANNGFAASAVKVTLRYPDTSPVFTWSGITSTESPVTTSVPGLATATGLAAAPRYALDANVWSDFAQSAKGNATAMTSPAVITVQRIYGGKLYPETKVKVYFAPGQLKGKVYYQSYETQLVKNSNYTVSGGGQVGAATLAITPGASAPTLVAGVAGTTAGEGCRVCHVVSGDGSTLLTQMGTSYGQTRRTSLTTSSPNDAVFTSNTGGLFAWAALTPAADLAVSHAGAAIATGPGTTYSTLYSMSTGTAISGTGLGSPFKAATPSFSPDETHLTFNYYNYDTRSLGIYDFNPSTLKFTNLRSVYTPPTGYVVWPTYTPASNQVIFGVQYSGGFGETWQSGTADLWRYDAATGTTDKMAKANGVNLPSGVNHVAATDAVMNFEPTMNPSPTANTGGFAWVVFTSRRLFGNVATLAPSCSDARTCAADLTSPTPKKLWMAAVNPTVLGGVDPSAPAFYLPGQELLAGNSRGFWVLDQCKPAGTTSASSCDTDLDCCQVSGAAERCMASNSTPPITKFCTAVPTAGTCSADNTTCSTTSQCCAALSGSQCVLNVCTPPPPLTTFSGASFTRDYAGTCPQDQGVVWRYFSWQSYTPGNSYIQFGAQTANTAAQITSATTMVAVGSAQSNSSWAVPAQTPTWTSASTTIDDSLRTVNLSSRSVLRVTAYLNPATSPSQTPVLEDWRATYDCVPNQ
jgi:hypothetical protein